MTLYGNKSADDHEIVQYTWEAAKSNPDQLDLTGVHKPQLTINNIRKKGLYRFILTVEDTIGQTDKADVEVFVKAAENKSPKARLGATNIVLHPPSSPIFFLTKTSSELILDASNSTDENSDDVMSYSFVYKAGPVEEKDVTIQQKGQLSPIASVVDLKSIGKYTFEVTVTDDGNPQLFSGVNFLFFRAF